MAASRVPATLTALATLWSAHNGPFVTGDFSDCLYVGYDGDPDGDFQAVDFDSEWAGLGAKARDEEFDVICASVALVGEDGGAALALENAYDQLETAAALLRADPSLGLSPPYTAAIKGGAVFNVPSPDGHQVRIVFRVHVKTRI